MSLLPASTIRALGQKEYEKRKQAALEVEAHVRELRDAQQYEKINAIVKHLALELANSAQAHVRKGALHALSGTAIGLRQHAGQMLPQLLPPVLLPPLWSGVVDRRPPPSSLSEREQRRLTLRAANRRFPVELDAPIAKLQAPLGRPSPSGVLVS
mmetsp:Transcript_23823/g.75455  ORF Transcript_23823/g.75455 Transcript_23823/m.75455 type:complete len:155 (-) Transcript_23823:487-951(-)